MGAVKKLAPLAPQLKSQGLLGFRGLVGFRVGGLWLSRNRTGNYCLGGFANLTFNYS